MRLPRGPAPGTLQLRVKFSPTGCQAGSGTSSTRSGRSATGETLLLETPGLRGTWRGTQGPREGELGDRGGGALRGGPWGLGGGAWKEGKILVEWSVAAENSRKVRMSPRACRVRRAQRKKQTGWVSGSRMSTSCRASQRKPLWVPFRRSEVSRPPRSGRGQLVLQFSHKDPPRSTSATRGCRSAQKGSCATADQGNVGSLSLGSHLPGIFLPLCRIRDSRGISRGHSRGRTQESRVLPWPQVWRRAPRVQTLRASLGHGSREPWSPRSRWSDGKTWGGEG